MSDVVNVTYLMDGTTHNVEFAGEHATVQMTDHCTVVILSERRFTPEIEEERHVYFFRNAEYVELHRG